MSALSFSGVSGDPARAASATADGCSLYAQHFAEIENSRGLKLLARIHIDDLRFAERLVADSSAANQTSPHAPPEDDLHSRGLSQK